MRIDEWSKVAEAKIVAQIKEDIDDMIKKPYIMVGGNPKSNGCFRNGRVEGLEEIKTYFTGGKNR